MDGMAVDGSGGMFTASAQQRVPCESLGMTRMDCPERAPWHPTEDTCEACGVQWSFKPIVIMNVTDIEGHHRGGALQKRIPGRCQTCRVVWHQVGAGMGKSPARSSGLPADAEFRAPR